MSLLTDWLKKEAKSSKDRGYDKAGDKLLELADLLDDKDNKIIELREKILHYAYGGRLLPKERDDLDSLRRDVYVEGYIKGYTDAVRSCAEGFDMPVSDKDSEHRARPMAEYLANSKYPKRG